MPVDGDIILKAGLDTTGVSERLDSLQKTVSKGLKNIIRVGFGVRSVFALIRKLRSALVEGFGNLAQVHQPFNQAVSEILTSLNLLKNSFAAAFAPIIETVAPILAKFITMIAEAVSWIGQLIAALTGKEYVRAAAVQVDYASSVNKSTASANKATSATKKQTKAQKELNREITHFDDLVILHNNKQDEADTSAPVGGGVAPSYSFSNVPIGDAVSKFAKDFMAAWNKVDFTDIGRKLGEKLKTALENIPWAKIKITLSKVAQSIATFLNGFLETPGLFTTIGKTIAEAINSAVLFVNRFVWKFHWDSLGIAIRDRLIAVLSNIDWDLIYNTARGFAIGLAAYLNELFKPGTFEAIGDTVGNLLNTALDFLNFFGEQFDATQFGTSLAAGINRAMKKVSPLKLISGAITVIKAIRDSIIGFMGGIEWYSLGVKLRDIIKNIPWKLLLLSVGLVIWQAINSAVELLSGLFDADNIGGPIQTAIKNLSNAIKTAAQNIDFKSIADGLDRIVKALAPAVEGFAAGFITAMSIFIEMGQGLLEALGPALQAIADALGLMDPDVVESVGTGLGLIAGALFAISLVNGVGTLLTNIATAIVTLNGVVPAAATALGIGQGGLAAALSGVTAAALGAWIGLTIFNEEVEAAELSDYEIQVDNLSTDLKDVQNQLGLTASDMALLASAIQNIADPTQDTTEWMRILQETCDYVGIDVTDLNTAIQGVVDTSDASPQSLSVLQSYLNEIGDSATTTDTNTSGLQTTFGLFNGLSITAPLKMALLSGAIKALGDKGKLSKEDTEALYTTLDEYNANPTEANMNKVATAFENTGISADDFTQSLVDSMMTMDTTTQKEIASVLKTIGDSGPNLKKKSKSSFENVGKGAKQGVKDTTKDVAKAGGEMVTETLDTMDKVADSHSPSREAMKRGKYIGQGLGIGLKNQQSSLVQIAGDLITAIKNKVDTYLVQFNAVGNNLMKSLGAGLSSGGTQLSSYMINILEGIYDSANSLSFWNVGKNIATGIYNGLFAHRQWLNVLAWNTAVSMYNNACAALRIASPSKKFAWIGEMIAVGLGNGVTDNQDEAVNAVTDMTKAMTDEAEEANPSIAISSSVDNWINQLDEVLTTFSDTVIDKFDNLITTFAQIGNIQATVPAIAQGKVIPSSIQAANSTNDAMASMLDMMQNLQASASDRMDVADLRTLLVEMFTQYMNLSIGDEQLARHVNNGNLLLGRRYSIIKE